MILAPIPKNVVKEFEKDFLKKEKSFPRIVPEDISVFDHPYSIDKNKILFTTGLGIAPIGSVLVGQPAIVKSIDQMRIAVRTSRSSLIRHSVEQVACATDVDKVLGFTWIVRLYRWLRHNGWELMSLKNLYLVDGLIHASENECHQELVIKNSKLDSTITIYKLFHKRGYLIKQRSLSSLIDKDNSDIKTAIVDTIIQIKNTIKSFSDDGNPADAIDLRNI